jgi:hypothetical protein
VVARPLTWNTGMGGKGRSTVRRRLTSPARRCRSRRALAFLAFVILAGSTAASYTATADDVAAGAATPAATERSAPAANPRGALLGVVPSRPPDPIPSSYSTSSTAAASRAAAQSQVTYHGGPVLHASNVYTIFWMPAGYTLPPNYTTVINQYFGDVAHDSYLPSNVYGSIVQYYESNRKRFVSYNVANKGPGIDTTPFPPNGCPAKSASYTLADGTQPNVCLTRGQLQKEIKAYVAAHSIPTGVGTQIFLFTPQGVGSCNNATPPSKGGVCYNPLQYNGYCAFHSHFGSGAQAMLYANMPYDAIQGCTSGQSPNGNAADAVLNNAAHEHNEMMTDPLGTAWYDSAGNEIADKCHLKFGKPLGSTSSGQYNQVINGHGYWLQALWSNRARACVQRNTFPQPIVSFTYTPSQPKHGKKVVFKSSVKEAGESKWTYRWSFPDGGTSAAANPSHVFKTFTFGDVVLIVTDTKGDQTRYSRTIVVQ